LLNYSSNSTLLRFDRKKTPENMVINYFSSNSLKIPDDLKKHNYIFSLKNNNTTLLKTFIKKGYFRKFSFSFLKAKKKFINKYSPFFKYINIFIEIGFSLISILQKFKVFFKFSFHTINKKIRKFSRGKSGKYKLVINFLPFYKRFRFILTLLKKNYKVAAHLPLKKKLMFINYIMYFKPKKTLVAKLLKFINFYVFRKKYKANLLTSN